MVQISQKLDTIELEINQQLKSCQKNPTCHRKPINKCCRNCCDVVKQRVCQTRKDQANFHDMQQQLASAMTMPIPKYAKRTKPTPGKGQGCGCPPRHTLPPLWMYSLATKGHRPMAPPRPQVPKRNHCRETKLKFRKNYADELGTHRYYLPT